jgi:hypothetical protein
MSSSAGLRGTTNQGGGVRDRGQGRGTGPPNAAPVTVRGRSSNWQGQGSSPSGNSQMIRRSQAAGFLSPRNPSQQASALWPRNPAQQAAASLPRTRGQQPAASSSPRTRSQAAALSSMTRSQAAAARRHGRSQQE